MDASQIITIIGGVLGTALLAFFTGLRKSNSKAISEQKTTMDEAVENLNEQIRNLKADYEGDMSKLRKERDEANMKAGQLQTQIDQLKEQVKELIRLNAEAKTLAENIAKERDTEIRNNMNLLENVAEANKMIGDQEREIRGLETRIRELEHQIAVNKSVETIVSTLATQLTNSIRDIVRSTGELKQVIPPAETVNMGAQS